MLRSLKPLLPVVVLAAFLGGTAPGARAGGTAAGRGYPWKVHRVLMIPQAKALCATHHRARFRATVQGFLVARFSLGPAAGGEGTIFATSDVPLNTGTYENPRFYGGFGVTLAPRRSPYAPNLYSVDLNWLNVSGLLECKYHPPGITVQGWKRVPAHPPERIPSLTQNMSVKAAWALCALQPSARYRATVHGFFVRAVSFYANSGGLFAAPVPRPDTTNSVPNIGGLQVVSSAQQFLPSGRTRGFSSSSLPDRQYLDVHGLLACSRGPPLLEAYGWRYAKPTANN